MEGLYNFKTKALFAGPSVMIHTVTSQQGGVFAVFVDDFNTTDVIDTYSGPDSAALPLCYPVQYPPFLEPPPTLASQSTHVIKLVYSGRSLNAPNLTAEHCGQFDAFAIPDLSVQPSQESRARKMGRVRGIFVTVIASSIVFSMLSVIL